MATLSDTRVRTAKARERPYKLFDERGLFLLVTPAGGRLWRLRYRMAGVEKLLALGVYPDVPLKRAREKRDEARRLIADGIDPNAQRKAERGAQAQTFEAVAAEWLELQKKSLAPETMSILGARLNSALYPYLGSRPVAAITAQELLAVLRRIEARGRHETAHRVRALAGRVLRYAVATGRAKYDVATDLRDALAPVKSHNFASVTEPVRVGELMRAIHRYSGYPVTALALKLAPLVFVRPGELRAAEWSEFDLRECGMAHPRRAYEDEGAAHRAARAPGDCDFARARTLGAGRALPISVASHPRSADVGEHDQCRAAPPGLQQRGADGTRLS